MHFSKIALYSLGAASIDAAIYSLERDADTYVQWRDVGSDECWDHVRSVADTFEDRMAVKDSHPLCAREGKPMHINAWDEHFRTAFFIVEKDGYICSKGNYFNKKARGDPLWINLGEYVHNGGTFSFASGNVVQAASKPANANATDYWVQASESNSKSYKDAAERTKIEGHMDKQLEKLESKLDWYSEMDIKFDDYHYRYDAFENMISSRWADKKAACVPDDDQIHVPTTTTTTTTTLPPTTTTTKPTLPPVVSASQTKACGNTQGKGICFTMDTSSDGGAGSGAYYYVWATTSSGIKKRLQLYGQSGGTKGYRICDCGDYPNTEQVVAVDIQQQNGSDGWKMTKMTADVNPGPQKVHSSRATSWWLSPAFQGGIGQSFWIDGDDCRSYGGGCCYNKLNCTMIRG